MNPPKRDKKYWEIVNRGCGGYRDYWGDYDCKHSYDWTCDECPVCIEHQKHVQYDDLNSTIEEQQEFEDRCFEQFDKLTKEVSYEGKD